MLYNLGISFAAPRNPLGISILPPQKRGRGGYNPNKKNIDSFSCQTYEITNKTDAINLVDDIVCDKIFKKKIIIDKNITFKRRIWEDTLFNHKYIITSKMVAITNQPLYYYRLNPKSASYTFTPQKLKAMIDSNNEIIDFLKRNDFDNDYIYNRLNKMWLELLKRMGGMNRKQRKNIFSNYNQDVGAFSLYISSHIHQAVSPSLHYWYYRIRTLGFKNELKSYIKKILKLTTT